MIFNSPFFREHKGSWKTVNTSDVEAMVPKICCISLSFAKDLFSYRKVVCNWKQPYLCCLKPSHFILFAEELKICCDFGVIYFTWSECHKLVYMLQCSLVAHLSVECLCSIVRAFCEVWFLDSTLTWLY